MNMLMTTDGYHLTMGFMLGDYSQQMETHIVYARTGGPLVVPNLTDIASRYLEFFPDQQDIIEAEEFWLSQGIPFHRKAWDKISRMKNLPISIRGVREGEVVLPGEPIAIIEAPAVLAAIPEPFFISALMKSTQLATRFTKISKALNWDRKRVFEVGMRAATSITDHIESIEILKSVGLQMSSSGIAAKQADIASGGSMGHRFTQRFNNDYDAFMVAVDKMIEFRLNNRINNKVNVSFLLDTINTLDSGLPAAVKVIKQRINDIRTHLNISVRLDSGNLENQLKVLIRTFRNELSELNYLPSIVIESGLTAVEIARFENIAKSMNYPQQKLLYGVGGYLAGNIDRDFVSMVYKMSSFNNQPTMKFSDEDNNEKESYPGKVSLLEREIDGEIKRLLVKQSEVRKMIFNGWTEVLVDIVKNGEVLIQPSTDEQRIDRLQTRWDSIANGYIGNDKKPAEFRTKPALSQAVKLEMEFIRKQRFNLKNLVA